MWGNADCGIVVGDCGDLTLSATTLRDHPTGRATGVLTSASGKATVGADCVFARNAGGDVVRA